MKKAGILILLTTISLSIFAQKERVENFRNINWGTHIDSVFINGEKINFKKVKEAITPNTYYLPNDDLLLGNVSLSKIWYDFNGDNRFGKVIIEGNREQLREVIFILNFKFGEDYIKSEVEHVTYRQWVVQDVTFTLSEFTAKNFNLTIESDWEQRVIIEKNSNVEDF